MKYVRIVKNTFIKGEPAAKGQEFEVDDRTAMLLGSKAIQIDKPGGKAKTEAIDGPLESFEILRQQETVVRPVDKVEPEKAAVENDDQVVRDAEYFDKLKDRTPDIVERGAGGKFKSKKGGKKR